jgi:N-acetylglucosamine-6-phosphate deacetylase
MLALGFSENEVSRMASANPARLLGIENERGTIEVGKRADLVGLDEKGNVALTIIGGRIAFTKNAA